jgi:hypothetical protein
MRRLSQATCPRAWGSTFHRSAGANLRRDAKPRSAVRTIKLDSRREGLIARTRPQHSLRSGTSAQNENPPVNGLANRPGVRARGGKAGAQRDPLTRRQPPNAVEPASLNAGESRGGSSHRSLEKPHGRSDARRCAGMSGQSRSFEAGEAGNVEAGSVGAGISEPAGCEPGCAEGNRTSREALDSGPVAADQSASAGIGRADGVRSSAPQRERTLQRRRQEGR